ncbi:hypothetical protein EVAR_18769_1 [Eumeta japonica]|uniref:Uncharacterized protein n=1 Tax=Eumeta variegata TaxID=151549 RepID=A0A4C1UP09_EUMVA|nr:hypothetical protein EVAR_18769_1 [Eumeta japonica]
MVKKARNNLETSCIHVIRDDGRLLNEQNNVKKRWKNYFESVVAYEHTVVDDNVTATEYMIDDGNKSEITMNEIMKEIKRLKDEKAAGYDRVSSEIQRGGEGIVASLLYRLFNKRWKSYRAPNNWSKAVIEPSIKGKPHGRERCGLKENVVTRVERGMLWWLGPLERMNESRLTKQIYRANVCDEKVGKGRPKSYADYIGGTLKKGQILSTRNRRACMKRLMDVSETREICEDRTIWKSIITFYPSGK